jgi:hypothetical protein
MKSEEILKLLFDEFREGDVKETPYSIGCTLRKAPLKGGLGEITLRIPEDARDCATLKVRYPEEWRSGEEILSLVRRDREFATIEGLDVGIKFNFNLNEPISPVIVAILARTSELLPKRIYEGYPVSR